MEHNMQASHEGQWMEGISRLFHSGRSRTKRGLASFGPSLKKIDVCRDVPKEYLCPISLELMVDPVLLVQSGQVYDRRSIDSWFKMGHNTDPITGIELSSLRLGPVYPLKSAIQNYAQENGIDLDVVSGDGAVTEPEVCTDYSEIGSLNAFGLDGVSVYDVQRLCQISKTGDPQQKLPAMKLLGDLSRYGDSEQLKRISKCLSLDSLKLHLEGNDQGLRIQSARLMLQYSRDHVSLAQALEFLKMPNCQLREEVLLSIWQQTFRKRRRMREVAQAAQDVGCREIVAVLKSLSDRTRNDDIAEEVQAYAAFIFCCMSFKQELRRLLIDEGIGNILGHFLNNSVDRGFRFCLLKACQYLCPDPVGVVQVHTSGATSAFVKHLPPLDPVILYPTRIFHDSFVWVTVAETAVKGLFYLSLYQPARRELRNRRTVTLLKMMMESTSFPNSVKAKYLGPLLSALDNDT